MNTLWFIIIALVLFLIALLLLSRNKPVQALFRTKFFEMVFNTGQPVNQIQNKDPNLIIAPDEGKYDFSSGILRHIPDPETLEAMGYNRQHFIRWGKEKFDSAPLGHPIQSVKTAQLYAKLNTTGVYAFIEGQKRWVPNPQTLQAMGRNFEEVKYLMPDAFDSIPQGIKLVDVAHWSTNR